MGDRGKDVQRRTTAGRNRTRVTAIRTAPLTVRALPGDGKHVNELKDGTTETVLRLGFQISRAVNHRVKEEMLALL